MFAALVIDLIIALIQLEGINSFSQATIAKAKKEMPVDIFYTRLVTSGTDNVSLFQHHIRYVSSKLQRHEV